MTTERSTEIALLRHRLESAPESIEFTDVAALIEQWYTFTPVAFRNGPIFNEPGQNSGSCRLFAFARLHDFTVNETLYCFGAYYRADVLKTPGGDSHSNIRQFMRTGWEEIEFDGVALLAKH